MKLFKLIPFVAGLSLGVAIYHFQIMPSVREDVKTASSPRSHQDLATAGLTETSPLTKQSDRRLYLKSVEEVLDGYQSVSSGVHLSYLFLDWVQEDPEAAVEALNDLRLVNTPDHGRLYYMVFEYLGENDPKLAMKLAAKCPGDRATSAYIAAIGSWASVSPIEALSAWEAIDDPWIKSISIGSLTAGWASKDADGAIAWVKEQQTNEAKSRAMRLLMTELAKTDPKKGIELIDEMTEKHMRSRAIQSLVQSWATQTEDFAEIADWLSAIGNESEASRMPLGSLSNFWIRNDLDGMATYVLEQDDPLFRNQLGAMAAGGFGRFAPQKGLLWLKTLEDGEAKQFRTSLYTSWAQYNPPELARHFALTDTATPTDYHTLAERWLNYDPKASAEWLLSQPEERFEPHTITNMVRRWMEIDSLEASTWIASTADLPHKDAAVSVLVHEIMIEDPKAARAWINTISDTDLKQRFLDRLPSP